MREMKKKFRTMLDLLTMDCGTLVLRPPVPVSQPPMMMATINGAKLSACGFYKQARKKKRIQCDAKGEKKGEEH
jgi:hypothetical protein